MMLDFCLYAFDGFEADTRSVFFLSFLPSIPYLLSHIYRSLYCTKINLLRMTVLPLLSHKELADNASPDCRRENR
jgi:hypothetical protein